MDFIDETFSEEFRRRERKPHTIRPDFARLEFRSSSPRRPMTAARAERVRRLEVFVAAAKDRENVWAEKARRREAADAAAKDRTAERAMVEEDLDAELAYLFWEGRTKAEVARVAGVTTLRVSSAFDRLGVDPSFRGPSLRDQRWAERYAGGESALSIAISERVDVTVVHAVVRAAGLTRCLGRGPKKRTVPA